MVSRRMYMDCACSIGAHPKRGITYPSGIDLFMLTLPDSVDSIIDLEYPITKKTICNDIPGTISKLFRSNEVVAKFYENL